MMVILSSLFYTTSMRPTATMLGQTSQSVLNAVFSAQISIPTFLVKFQELASGLRLDFSEPMMQFMDTSTFPTSFQNGNRSYLGYTKCSSLCYFKKLCGDVENLKRLMEINTTGLILAYTDFLISYLNVAGALLVIALKWIVSLSEMDLY